MVFSVDYLLPVQIDKHCVGVVFRDGDATMILIDHYDITNKASHEILAFSKFKFSILDKMLFFVFR